MPTMHEDDLNDIVHILADELDKYLGTAKVDRHWLNDKVTAICNDLSIDIWA